MHTTIQLPLKKQIISGIMFTAILGTIWHFLYPLSSQNFLVGLFAPVNESTWEHLKLLFFPMLIFICRQSWKHPHNRTIILSSGLFGILTGLIAIPILFYGYQAVLGKDYIVIDILIFLISVCLAFMVYYLLLKKDISLLPGKISITILILLTIAFAFFSYMPPDNFLFKPPV